VEQFAFGKTVKIHNFRGAIRFGTTRVTATPFGYNILNAHSEEDKKKENKKTTRPPRMARVDFVA
jgi:hypothetical protein